MSTLVLTLAYNGCPFAGFARQPGQLTVQGELETALATVLRREVETTCAGRTDAGVHAKAQQLSFEVNDEELAQRSLSKLQRSLNALTSEAIVVSSIRLEPAAFSARFDALSREYCYRIVEGEIPPLFLKDFVWWLPGEKLDVDAMREGAQYLIGEHDFKSFCLASSAEGKSTSRELKSIELFYEEHLGEPCLVIRIVGNAFLHNMVRIIVGTLVEVGCGRRTPAWVAEVLSACDRKAAGPTAPACGLTFWLVEY